MLKETVAKILMICNRNAPRYEKKNFEPEMILQFCFYVFYSRAIATGETTTEYVPNIAAPLVSVLSSVYDPQRIVVAAFFAEVGAEFLFHSFKCSRNASEIQYCKKIAPVC